VGNLIKINIYVEMKRKNNYEFKLGALEETILKYNNWLKKTNREDKIENYKKYLQY